MTISYMKLLIFFGRLDYLNNPEYYLLLSGVDNNGFISKYLRLLSQRQLHVSELSIVYKVVSRCQMTSLNKLLFHCAIIIKVQLIHYLRICIKLLYFTLELKTTNKECDRSFISGYHTLIALYHSSQTIIKRAKYKTTYVSQCQCRT